MTKVDFFVCYVGQYSKRLMKLHHLIYYYLAVYHLLKLDICITRAHSERLGDCCAALMQICI